MLGKRKIMILWTWGNSTWPLHELWLLPGCSTALQAQLFEASRWFPLSVALFYLSNGMLGLVGEKQNYYFMYFMSLWTWGNSTWPHTWTLVAPWLLNSFASSAFWGQLLVSILSSLVTLQIIISYIFWVVHSEVSPSYEHQGTLPWSHIWTHFEASHLFL